MFARRANPSTVSEAPDGARSRIPRLRLAVMALSVLSLLGGSVLAQTGAAEAHERRAVAQYTFVVGWLNEPAILNQPNAIDLRISRTDGAVPVTGLEQTVKVQASIDGKSSDIAVRPRFNTPGAYDGRMVPTKLGAYTFTFTGTVEGMTLNEKFTAGTGTFGLIEEGVQFPDPLVSNQELDETLGGLQQRIVTLQADSGGSDSGSVMTVAIAGVVIGILGLAAAGFSLMRKPA
jgi:hypothetical protein